MTKTEELYIDVGSPTAYLAHKRLQQLQTQYGCEILYRPILLGGLFKATGNNSPIAVPAKGRYMMAQDLPRYAALYHIPLNNSSHLPLNNLKLMRGAVAAINSDSFAGYIDAVFNAIWVDGKNMGDIDVVTEVLSSAQLNVNVILASTQDPDVKAALIQNTEVAVQRGLFGAPTMFVEGEMFFGQDRLQFVELAIQE